MVSGLTALRFLEYPFEIAEEALDRVGTPLVPYDDRSKTFLSITARCSVPL